MIDSASLCVSKCVNALNGTGFDPEVLGAAPPCDEPGGAELDEDAGRDVPFNEVVALDDVPVLVLVLPRTVELELAVADGERADVWLLFREVELTLKLPAARGEVEDAGIALAEVVAAVSSAFPEFAVAPAPAPDDDPAVFDATVVGDVAIEDAWI